MSEEINSGAEIEMSTAAEEAPAEESAEATIPETAPSREQRFDELVRGEYKDLFDARMSSAVKKRLRNIAPAAEKYGELSDALRALAGRLGVPEDDAGALREALERGLAEAGAEESVERPPEREREAAQENMAALKNREKRSDAVEDARREAGAQYGKWMKQSEETRALYRGFSMRRELENPRFRAILRSGGDVRTAYEVVHHNEIIPAVIRSAVIDTERKLRGKILTGGMRPVENGSGEGAAATLGSGVMKMTRTDRDEIARRVMRGEKITL